MSERIELTAAGLEHARDAIGASLVARVAVAGYDVGWPSEHVAAAIQACNERGALERRAAYDAAVAAAGAAYAARGALVHFAPYDDVDGPPAE